MALNKFENPVAMPDNTPILFGDDGEAGAAWSDSAQAWFLFDADSESPMLSADLDGNVTAFGDLRSEGLNHGHFPIDIFADALPPGASAAGARAMVAVNTAASTRRVEFPANSFAHTADSILQTAIRIPDSYAGQSLRARFTWVTLDTAVGDPVENVRFACVILNKMEDGADIDFDLGQLANPGATKAYAGPKRWHVAETAGFVPAGIVGGDHVIVQVRRIVGVTDNLATTVYLTGAQLELAV